MKKTIRNTGLLLALFLLMAALTGCAGAAMESTAADMEMGYSTQYKAEAEAPMAAEPMEAPAPLLEEMGWDNASGTMGANVTEQQKKIIRTAWLSLETRQFDQAMEELENTVETMGGYIQNSRVDGRKPQQWNDGGRYASLCLRIPAERLDEFLSITGELFDVVSQSSDVENVTTQYYDAKARKESYELQLERLESILAESADLADVLALETEIARVRYEIESLETQLRGLDNQVSYSTVNLDIRELNGLERPQAAEQTLGERMRNSFTRSFRNAGESLEDFAVWLSGSIPTLVLWAAIIAVVVIVFKKLRARKEAKRESRAPSEKKFWKKKKALPEQEDNNQQAEETKGE